MAQRHTRIIDGERYIWFTERLWKLSAGLAKFEHDIDSISELDQDCWFGRDRSPTVRLVAEHAKRILKADLSYPVILNSDGTLMDGGHRICKAIIAGKKTITAVKFEEMPDPDEKIPIEESTEPGEIF